MILDTLYLVHHSHTDLGFTHEQPVALDLHAQFIDQAIEECERTADFPRGSALKWTCEAVYPVLHWLRNRPGRQIQRFAKLARAGRIEVTGMFAVMCQCLPQEALYRQFQWVEELRRDLQLTIRSALQCDINGQHWGLVDALLDCGFDAFGMAINENVGRAAFQSQRPNGFHWEGPSGRRILAWNGLHYNANAYFGIPDDIERAAHELPRFLNWLAGRGYPHPFCLFQVTCNGFVDNGPVDPRLAPFVRRWNAEGRMPRMEIVTLGEFFDRLRREPPERLPAHRGEWTDYWNFGAASTAYETALNRRTYHRLAEGELALAFLGGKTSRQKELREAWENALLFDEHTWGADTSVVYPFGQAARSQLNQKLNFAYRARSLAQLVRLEAIDRIAHSLKTKESGLLVFNPLPWEREERVEFPENWQFRNPWQPPGAAATVSHVQALDRNEGSEQSGLGAAALLQSAPLKIPALGYRFFPFETLGSAPSVAPKGRISLSAENRWLKVAFDPERGGLKKFYDTTRGKEWVDRRHDLAFGGYVHETIPPSRRKGAGYGGRMRIFQESDWSRFMAYGGWNARWPARRRGISRVLQSRRTHLPGGVRLYQKCSAPGTRCVEYELTLLDSQPWADWRVTIDKTWDIAPEACYVAFPLALRGGWPRYQTAGGAVRPHIDQLPGCNQDFHTAQEWADFSNPESGFTITTIDAPIVMFGGFQIGRLFDGPRPAISPLILSLPMTNYYHVNYAGAQTGRVDFRYRLYPHGPFDAAECDRVGREAAHPLVCHPVHAPRGSSAVEESRLRLDGATLLSLRSAPDGSSCLSRLFNALDVPCAATLSFPSHRPAKVELCDGAGNPVRALRSRKGTWTVPISPRTAILLRIS